MNFTESILRAWNQIDDLEVPERDDKCFYAQRFAAWVEQLVTGIREPNIVLVNQAKILLQDKFFEWLRYVPNAHRMRLGFRGHTCIFQVWVTGYERLKVMEISMSPPLVLLPENIQPVIPPPPIIGGIFLGEDLGRRDDEKGESK